jgi:hypothetical protein
MEYLKEYEPLYLATKKLKKSSQVKGLSMTGALGSMPAGVDKETAVKFTSEFFSAVKEAVRKEQGIEDPKKSIKFKLIKKKMKEIREKVMGPDEKKEVKKKIVEKTKPAAEEKMKPAVEEKTKPGKNETELSFLKSKGLSFDEQYALKKTFEMMCDVDVGKNTLLSKEAIGKFFSLFHFELTDHDCSFLIGRLCESEKCTELPEGATFIQFAMFAKRLIYSNTNGSLKNAFQILTGLGEENTSPNPEEAELTTQQINLALKNIREKQIDDENKIEALHKQIGKLKPFTETMISYVDRTPKTLSGEGVSSSKKKSSKKKKAAVAVPEVKIDQKDPKYSKYFRLFKMLHQKGPALQKAQTDGLSQGEIAALDKALV